MVDLDEPRPDWATGVAFKYTTTGAVLLTRDGRRIGNSVVTGQTQQLRRHGSNLAWEVITDAGTSVYLTEKELHQLFHPPKWITVVATCPAYRAYLEKHGVT